MLGFVLRSRRDLHHRDADRVGVVQILEVRVVGDVPRAAVVDSRRSSRTCLMPRSTGWCRFCRKLVIFVSRSKTPVDV